MSPRVIAGTKADIKRLEAEIAWRMQAVNEQRKYLDSLNCPTDLELQNENPSY